MEKKTIGKFISALRRANGMTQKELAELLYVSDKTVSRWECDECTPDLSLIPAIADIFGVTADELLRGERRSREETAETSEGAPAANPKSDKQFRTMLRRRKTGYENLTWISFGILFCGLITSMICNLFFSGALGFFLAAIFIAAAVICQVCFVKNTLFAVDEDDERGEDYRRYNTSAIHRAIPLYIAAAVLFVALLPMAVITDAYTGVDFSAWIFLTLIFGGIALVLSYLVYIFAIKPRLLHSPRLVYAEKASEMHKKEKKLLIKTASVAIILGIILFVGATVSQSINATVFAEPYVFDNYEDFKDFMLDVATNPKYFLDDYGGAPHYTIQVDYWNDEGEHVTDIDGNKYYYVNDEIAYPIRTITDVEGNVLCEYVHPNAVSLLEYSKGGLLVSVYLTDDMRTANDIKSFITAMIFVAIGAEVVLCGIIYGVKLYKLKKE